MHELGIAMAQDRRDRGAERSGGARVARVVVEIGKLAAVLPDAVRFCFDAAAAGTVVEGATLEIREMPGHSARCRACDGES